ncbi:arginine/serine-rich coiled-coil protein 2 isoform X5 [Diaphorina citri]|uniref:Arginine/serine-rich coiled-coil protein 2 isoform X3 n=1 Tax=Diaphorina citri TaxID=121845 RepID=A0A3Q0JB27_DIACI|nr:arginine/serine-rich coiled-coil protein 2 isoform X3 [Diaphorina citri]XP_026685719.1 arginine/serine-rich coiled-coil protein 2 isoform X5 [Diaphorina citri]
MDSLCNYGSDEESAHQSQHRSSYNSANDWQNEQDVNYEPVTMDMSEDSNEEEYYARKYGKYADVAAAASARRRHFDPYEDDVSDAPTSPEPDPPTGSHERDPHANNSPYSQSGSTNRDGSSHNQFNQSGERDRDDSHNQFNQSGARDRDGSSHNQFNQSIRDSSYYHNSAPHSRGANENEALDSRGGEERRGGGGKTQYPSYYERAKRKMNNEEASEEAEEAFGRFDGDDRHFANNGKGDKLYDRERGNGFPPSNVHKSDRHFDRHDRDRCDEDRPRDRSHDREHKSKRGSSRHRDRDRERSRDRSSERDRDRRSSHEKDRRDKDRKHLDKDKDKRRRRDSRSRSKSRDKRDKRDRKSSRRSHRSRSRSHSRSRSRSRSSSKSRSHHSSRHRRGHSSSSRRDRRSREPSIGDLPRPYAPYERKPNKLQILEKLGIELKVPDQPPAPGQPPQVIAVPSSKAVGAHTGPVTTAGASGGATVTPQDLLQKTIAAQVEKIKADTGIELPKYYNPMAINPTKYAEQIQKRRLLWGNKQPSTSSTTGSTSTAPIPTTAAPVTSVAPTDSNAAKTATIWQGATFSGDQDGRMTSKFQRLMGIKNAGAATSSSTSNPAGASSSTAPAASSAPDSIRKQEEMFNSMESQYEAARLATHTHRGLGLGFGTFQYSQR